MDAQKNESDQGYAGYAVSFKAVSAWANGVAGVVTGAIGNYARVASVIFFDFEDDLHQVGADIGDFGEDAAGNTQGSRAQRFTNREADKAGARQLARNKQQ